MYVSVCICIYLSHSPAQHGFVVHHQLGVLSLLVPVRVIAVFDSDGVVDRDGEWVCVWMGRLVRCLRCVVLSCDMLVLVNSVVVAAERWYSSIPAHDAQLTMYMYIDACV